MKVGIREIAKRAGLTEKTVQRYLAEGRTVKDILQRRLRVEGDLKGCVFDRLMVLGVYDKRPHRVTRWLCQCSCGKQCRANAFDLRSGKQRSCGCLRNELGKSKRLGCGADLTGQIFGRLRVIKASVALVGGHEQRRWECLCACGELVVDVLTGVLTGGGKSSCGCARKHIHTLFGQELTIEDLAELAGMSVGTLYRHLRTMSPEDCVGHRRSRPGTKKGARIKRYSLNGKPITLKQMAKLCHLSVSTVIIRLKSMDPEELVCSSSK